MAVSGGQEASLTPAYSNITDQLKTSANLALNKPNILNAATQTVDAVKAKKDKIDAERFEVGKMYLQHSFTSAIQKQQQDFDARGDVIITPDHAAELKKQFGYDLPPELLGKPLNYKDFAEQTQKAVDFAKSKKAQAIINNPNLDQKQKALQLSVLNSDTQEGLKDITGQAAKAAFATPKANKDLRYPDSTSASGYRYAQTVDDNGIIQKTADDLEAPAPSSAKAGAGKPLPSKDRDAAIARNEMMDRVQGAIDNFDPKFVGPAASIVTGLKQTIGIGATKKQANFQANVNGMKNTLLKLRNGARITQTEYERLLSEIPTDAKSPEDFADKMASFTAALNETQKQYDDANQAAGYISGTIPKAKYVTLPENFGPNYRGKSAAPKSGGPVQVNSAEEWKALKPGTPYIDSHGNPGVKK